MKKNIIYIMLATLTGLFSASCTKDFENINSDKSVVSDIDVKYLFTYSCEWLQNYREGEWVWEDAEQWLRAAQLLTAENYELSGSVNSRYGTFYQRIMPNLFEMRKLISTKTDKDGYQNMVAATYIVQIFQALKVTDMNGSIPYTEANMGRENGKYNPVYDTQKTLFDTWVTELNSSISVLESNLENQVSLGNNDVFYRGDWSNWVRLANALKLRIAARYQNQDAAKAKEIFQQVMSNSTGVFRSTLDQMTYNNSEYGGFTEIDYRSRRFAMETVVNFMKSTGDPRLGIYYEKNSLVGAFRDSLTKYKVTLPSWIDVNDPNIQWLGGPADWQGNPDRSNWFYNQLLIGNNKYSLISGINRRFFHPRIDGANGRVIDVILPYAEVCLQIAEFIQKGYGSGVDTKGSATDWYEKGVRASIETMNEIAIAAGSYSVTNVSTLIDAYLQQPKVKLDGSNNLEKIYIQQLFNFYKMGNEAFALVRRTGFPKFNSTLLARQTTPDMIARRYWLLDPGEVNRANWLSAMTEQGFTPGDRTMDKLSTERVWWDKPSPNFGGGN
jgi:hypothetical protein